MSKSLRAQVSLTFFSEDLFDNFITPLKENKELSSMIIKLLQAYYENEEVRNLVEGISLEDAFDNSSQIIDSTEAINNMRQTLAMQDFLFEQAKLTLDNGASEMDTLMRANDIAKQSGVVKTESTDVGEALVALTIKNPISESPSSEVVQPTNGVNLEDRVGKIEEVLANIMSMLQNGSLASTNTAIPQAPIVEEVQEEVKTPSLSTETQVLTTEEEEPVVSPPIIESTESSIPVVEEGTEDEPNPEVEEDASSILGDFLKDLLG